MDKKKIVAIIPVRKNSQRIKNKNFLSFYKGKSLLELKIEQLKKVKNIDEIVVSSDAELAKKISKSKIEWFKILESQPTTISLLIIAR